MLKRVLCYPRLARKVSGTVRPESAKQKEGLSSARPEFAKIKVTAEFGPTRKCKIKREGVVRSAPRLMEENRLPCRPLEAIFHVLTVSISNIGLKRVLNFE